MSKKEKKLLKVKKDKKSLWKEFTEFAIKGNAMALAVGTIIGAAFSTIMGGADFSEWKIELPYAPWVKPEMQAVLDEAGNPVLDQCGEVVMEEVPNYLTFGNIISAVINFLILALVVFFIVKGINKLTELGKKKEVEEAAAEPPAPPAPSNEEILLTEIRDLLKNK